METLLTCLILIAVTFVNAANHDAIEAHANIRPNCKQTYPYRVYGKVHMQQKASGGLTTFKVKLEGLEPNSVHGFHIHATGDIFTKGCSSTGGHYNPFGVVHGDRLDKVRHVGDLGNLKADSTGKIDVTFADKHAGLIGKHSIAGRAFVVHALADDLGKGKGAKQAGSLKTGNAGARLACGIIFYV